MEFHIVSDCCPVGCGTEVVLLRALRSGIIFAYCDACGCVWHNPQDAKFAAGLNYVTSAIQVAPDGVDVPPTGEISASRWAKALVRAVSSSDWQSQVDELNKSIRAGLPN
jgi:hypothetical protein